MMKGCLLIILIAVLRQVSFSQDTSRFNKLLSLPGKLFSKLDQKTASIENKLDKQTGKYLNKLARQEHKLRKKLWKKDSTLAKQLFDGADEKYAQLKSLNLSTPKQSNKSDVTLSLPKGSSVYSGHLDSLTTSLKLLQDQNITNQPALQKTLDQYKALQLKLNASGQIKNYITQRREFLKEQFKKLGMIKELKKFRKQVYYYQAQVTEYKRAFEDPNKLEEKLLLLAMKLQQFKNFFAKNSLLGSLFALPNSNAINTTASLAGLQTRAMISQSIISRFGSSASVTQMLQQNVQSAQGQLDQLKSKLSSYSTGSYGNGDDFSSPEGGGRRGAFKPNNQKTKSFFQRLEIGSNVQSQRARYFFPVTSDIGLSLGYKLNDKSILGIGASYKLGWGSNWSNIRLSHQGIGLRSYLDWKIKGSVYLSGGYEQNYRSLIISIGQLKNYSAWQTSGLVGLNKKYSISKKIKGEMKLLWDFLSYQQVPRTQPIIFRVGYSLK